MSDSSDRRLGEIDRLIIAFDRTLRGAARTSRGGMSAAPVHTAAEDALDGREPRHPTGAATDDALDGREPRHSPGSAADDALDESERRYSAGAGAEDALDEPDPRHPAGDATDDALDERERRHSAGLMRVDHAGEVAAQALYRGQALTARDPAVRAAMEEAAREESDHLAWCRARLEELGAAPSRLDPLWYAGSLAIGAVAGLAGDRWSLGFVVETERQVAEHLGDHLARLPAGDHRSRALLRQMRADEQRHATRAHAAGGAPLPPIVRRAMRAASRIMTRSAYWI